MSFSKRLLDDLHRDTDTEPYRYGEDVYEQPWPSDEELGHDEDHE